MAIYGIGGKPGGGKTFFCCHHILRKYFEWDKLHGEFMRKFPVEIISNIEDLKLQHFSLDEMIERSGKGGIGGTVETFFTVDYQRRLMGRFSRVVYFIDEAGKYFPSGFKVPGVLAFFQYHRHLGIDVYLMSAALEGISRGILMLLEYRLIAKERSKRVLNEFRYHKYVGGDKVGTVVLKPDNRIFSLYRSMDLKEQEKIPAVTRRYAVMILVFLVAGIVLFRYTVATFGSSNNPGSKKVRGGSLGKAAGVVNSGSVELRATSGGVPLQVRAGGLEGVVKNEVALDVLKGEYVRIFVSADVNGGSVIYGEDGVHYVVSDIPVILRDAVRVGGALYVRRVALAGVAARQGSGGMRGAAMKERGRSEVNGYAGEAK